MATEHEYKYVIHRDSEKHMTTKFELVEQGYLAFSKGMSARIRSTTKPANKKQHWTFTFKQKVKSRVIELERRISERDGQELWNMAVGKLRKRRYKRRDSFGNGWDVDFFYDKKNSCYFAVAEVELEEGAPPPKKLPEFIKKFLVYEVPLTDDRFSNKKLGDADYAADLYKSLTKEGVK